MAEESTSTITKKYISAANLSTKATKSTSTAAARQSKLISQLGHFLAGVSAVGASVLAASGLNLPRFLEAQAQTLFYQIRGAVNPPEDIVILAIDDASVSVPQQYYKTDPQQYAEFKPLKTFPFQRSAYATVIEKLIEAGARAVAVDVVFDGESAHGVNDDQKLLQALRRYGSQVTLAAVSESFETHQGEFIQLRKPQPMFRSESVLIGLVNFPLKVDGRIHQLASKYRDLLAENDALTMKMLSFDEAALLAAEVSYPPPKGDHIHFYGPAGTFKVIPFWYVFDSENWNTYLHQGKIFKDKIVLIGATAQLGNDYHPVAVAKHWPSPELMSGVEIHANAIATLIENKAIAQAIPSLPKTGLFVLGLVGGCAVIISRKKSGIIRFFLSIAFAITWGGISYFSFVYGLLILPTAIPMAGLVAVGLCYLGTEFARELLRKSFLVDMFQKYSSHRVVQEIISQQDDLKDLLQQREIAISGKILDGRYKIVKVLGYGGFSETYVAEDIRLPGSPQCVVKQLKPASAKSEQLRVARRLFNSEAQTLQKLGTHNQIPQLLAYFEEEEEFYLVQEYILGHPLNQELCAGKCLEETAVIEILRELLQILAFVHQNGVIHRDIKPSNIMRRHSDGKLVLIDFGAVKEVTTQILDNQQQTAFTIGIGTKGYAPSEQCFGRPHYSSDIYAVGMIGIKALTGIAPHELDQDANGQLKWTDKANVSHSLAEFLSKMVHDDFQQRYQSASQALEALDKLPFSRHRHRLSPNNTFDRTSTWENTDVATTPWIKASEENTNK
jgi:CHASE2 domain-containing sensor protein/tRNA A-37 threonylcarbamoyl transferase component Bud32